MRTLYQYQNCPFCFRVRVALGEKGLPFAGIEVDPQHKPEELLSVAPLGSVPVLVEDGPSPDVPGIALFDSGTIVEYLDSLAGPPLIPPGPKARARARMLESLVTSGLLPHVAAIAKHLKARSDPSTWDMDLMKFSHQAIRRWLGYFESALGGGEFLLGQLSIVDAAIAFPLGAIEGVGLSLDAWPNLQKLSERLEKRQSVVDARRDLRRLDDPPISPG